MSLATALDLAQTTLDRIAPQVDLNFAKMATLHAELIDRGGGKFPGGKYVKFPFTYGGVGRSTAILSGAEPLHKGRDQKLQSLEYELHRVVHTLHLPRRELIHNQGKEAIIDLMAQGPLTDMECFIQDRENFILTGANADNLVLSAADAAGFLCFNGEYSGGNGLRGVTNGLLDFALPASQTATVGNVAKSEAQKHFNQYAQISSWSTDGLKTLKRVLRTCAKWGGHKDAKSYLILMDNLTFGNFEDERAGQVRIRIVNDLVEKDLTFSLDLMGAKVHHSLHLDPAQFTGTGSAGVTYMIDLDNMKYEVAEKFELQGKEWRDSEDQDVIFIKAACHEQMGAKRLPAFGVVAGGNT